MELFVLAGLVILLGFLVVVLAVALLVSRREARTRDTERRQTASDETGHRTDLERQADLERRVEQLEAFPTLVAHDLRNPLDVAIGQTNAVADQLEDPELEAHLGKAAAAHERMRRLIDDVLTLARDGDAVGELATASLEETARDAWEHVDTRGATLAVETGMELRSDPDALERIFENLFRNCREHGSRHSRTHSGDTTQNSPMTVRVAPLENGDGFFVADDGAGIPESAREDILESGYTTREGGTGLGLAIVTQLATAHGWDLSVTESDGGGAQFEFSGVDVLGNPSRE